MRGDTQDFGGDHGVHETRDAQRDTWQLQASLVGRPNQRVRPGRWLSQPWHRLPHPHCRARSPVPPEAGWASGAPAAGVGRLGWFPGRRKLRRQAGPPAPVTRYRTRCCRRWGPTVPRSSAGRGWAESFAREGYSPAALSAGCTASSTQEPGRGCTRFPPRAYRRCAGRRRCRNHG
jgi:hypothetical protein